MSIVKSILVLIMIISVMISIHFLVRTYKFIKNNKNKKVESIYKELMNYVLKINVSILIIVIIRLVLLFIK